VVFSSVLFLFYFLPTFLLCYYTAKPRWRNAVLLLFSLVFYAWGAPEFVLWLVGVGMAGHYLVQAMHRADHPRNRGRWLALFIGFHLGVLGWFKYANFTVDNVRVLAGLLGVELGTWEPVVLPIGISFFTFQAITYAVDVYRREDPPVNHPTAYLMYLMMFPQLIAGPIVRYKEVAAAMVNRTLQWPIIYAGMFRFVVGLSKKVLLANPLGEQADGLLANLAVLNTADAWLALGCYTLQIFFDFSGYSDMAIGLGQMMGFHFPENFKQPYRSTSITEFWQRWHITLGSFMRHYLYIPLGGNRRGAWRTYLNLMIVFLLSGLWHGASWNFVAWGAFHGLWLVVERLGGWTQGSLWRRPLTLFLVMMGWVLFRAPDFVAAGTWFGALFGRQSGLGVMWMPMAMPMLCLGSILALWPARWQWQPRVHWSIEWLGAFLLGLLTLSAVVASSFNPFIYFRF
jgi:alginate O-acetyltransferase complex protein AlgI